METRLYPLTDELKELTSDALDELARRLIDEAAAVIKAETPTAKLLAAELLAAELLERAAQLREASDYYLHL